MIDEAEILDLRKEIAATFTELRMENGWNKRTASFEVGIPVTTLGRIEHGSQDVYLSTLQKMAYAYGYGVEIGFVPLDEPDISEGDVHGEDSDDVPSESGGSLSSADGGPSGLPVGA